MEKANVIKALEMCSGPGHGICNECPYGMLDNCANEMQRDAAALLKASETPKANHKYTSAIIFIKRTNLSAYCNNKVYSKCGSDANFEAMRKYYAKEREVQLILLTRYEKGKLMCRIKCPINPLPVKGEFEAPSLTSVEAFLYSNGWKFKQKFYPQMFE